MRRVAVFCFTEDARAAVRDALPDVLPFGRHLTAPIDADPLPPPDFFFASWQAEDDVIADAHKVLEDLRTKGGIEVDRCEGLVSGVDPKEAAAFPAEAYAEGRDPLDGEKLTDEAALTLADRKAKEAAG